MELTKCELEVMDVLWNAGVPLSRKDLLDHKEDKTWKDSSVHILLNSLLNKNAIHADGYVKRTKTVARTFSPSINREQYFATTIFSHTYKPDVMGVLRELIHGHSFTNEEIDEITTLLKEKASALEG